MSSLQVSVQLVLIGLNDSDIVFLNTELSAMEMLAQTGRLDFLNASAPRLLLWVFESKTFASDTHLERLVISEISAGGRKRAEVEENSRPKEDEASWQEMGSILNAKGTSSPLIPLCGGIDKPSGTASPRYLQPGPIQKSGLNRTHCHWSQAWLRSGNEHVREGCRDMS